MCVFHIKNLGMGAAKRRGKRDQGKSVIHKHFVPRSFQSILSRALFAPISIFIWRLKIPYKYLHKFIRTKTIGDGFMAHFSVPRRQKRCFGIGGEAKPVEASRSFSTNHFSLSHSPSMLLRHVPGINLPTAAMAVVAASPAEHARRG